MVLEDKQEFSRKGVGKIPDSCEDRWQEASWHRARGDRAEPASGEEREEKR